jgi:tetratricopeptide (TPR) repeat protein
MNQLDGLVGGDAYAFVQQDSIIEITFPVPLKTTTGDIEFSLDCESRAICVGVRDAAPALVGVLWQPATKESATIRNGTCIVQLAVDAGAWPIVIAERSSRGIDANSLYLLALWHATERRYSRSKPLLLEAANHGSAKALLMLVNLYLEGSEEFAIQPDSEKVLSFIQKIPQKYHTSKLAMAHARVLNDCGSKLQAIQVLRRAAETSPTVRWELITYLRTVRTEFPSADAEIVANLEILQAADDAQAITDLATCLETGAGVPKDLQKARELRKRLPGFVEEEPASVFTLGALTAGIAAAIFGIGLGVSLARVRRD